MASSRDSDEHTDDRPFGGVTYGPREGPRSANPKDDSVWRRSEGGGYGLTESWLGGRGDPDAQDFDDRDYYGETHRGQHPPERNRFDHDRHDPSRWARDNPHGSARGYDIDLERHSYRRTEAQQTLPSVGDHAGKGPRGYRRDERIRDAVCEALTHAGNVDASDIEVQCDGGTVTLTGTVADRRQKRLAEAIADAQPGVEDVSNLLRIAAPTQTE